MEHEQLELADKEKINQETSSIAWRELQRFFASGHAIYIDPKLDLVDVAYQISIDNAEQIQSWMQDRLIANVSDAQAQQWYDDDANVWAVVIKPWVLVQTYNAET